MITGHAFAVCLILTLWLGAVIGRWVVEEMQVKGVRKVPPRPPPPRLVDRW